MTGVGQRRNRGIVFVTLLAGLAALALLAALLLALASAWYWPQLPPLDKVTDYQPRQPLQVFTADGVEIAQFGSERRQFVPIERMPRRLQDAVLAVEDTQFREHFGISLKGLLRATVANLTGGMPQGASTITQQVARTFFLSTRRTAERKIKEALLSLQIEQRLSKDQILELYLNQIYLGQRAYGFAAASQVYFGKPLDQLGIAETAMLAGLPQNPIWANPIVNFERARKRQAIVLARMQAVGLISAAEREMAFAEKLVLRSPGQVDVHAQHVAEMARLTVVERFGEQAYSQGIRVYTSLRSADQQTAHAALRRALLAHERKQPWRGPEDQEDLPENEADTGRLASQALRDHRDDEDLRVAIVTQVTQAAPYTLQAVLASGQSIQVQGEGLKLAQAGLGPKASAALALRRGSIVRVVTAPRKDGSTDWQLLQWPQADGAFVALDPATGRVRALVGGFAFNQRQFNHVTKAWRQPGSSFKPFFYSAALEQGVMPETLVNDAPLTQTDGSPSDWQPQNSDGRFDGPLTVREALARSKNLVSVRVLRQVGLPTARQWVGRFGFDVDKQPDNLTFALGAGSVTPLQMARGYAVFANGGYRIEATLIERIVDAKGQEIFRAPPTLPLTEDQRVLSERNVFLMRSLMAEVTSRGTAARAQAALQRPDLYGKTGTTNDAVDAWFAGFQPGLVAVAWMGYDEPRSLGERESGGGLSLPPWIDYMARALKGVPVAPLTPPFGVTRGAMDWRYDEWLDGGIVERIGLPPPEVPPPDAAASTASR